MSLYSVIGNFYSYQCNVTKYMYSSTPLSNLRSFTEVAPFAGRQLNTTTFQREVLDMNVQFTSTSTTHQHEIGALMINE